MLGTTFILLVALAASPAFANTFVEITLSARDLPDGDTCCSAPVLPPDAYAVVSYAASDFDSYVEVGQTIIIDNKHSPSWPEIFAFKNESTNSTGKIKVIVWDSDVLNDENMGFIEFRVRDLLTSFGQSLEKVLNPSQKGYVIVNGRFNGTFAADEAVEKKFENQHRIIQLPELRVINAEAAPKSEVTIKKIQH